MVASLSARIAPMFVAFAPIGTYFFLHRSGGVSSLHSRTEILQALSIPEALSSHHLDMHGLPSYFDTMAPLKPALSSDAGNERSRILGLSWDAYDTARGDGTGVSPGQVSHDVGGGDPGPLATATVVEEGALPGFDSL